MNTKEMIGFINFTNNYNVIKLGWNSFMTGFWKIEIGEISFDQNNFSIIKSDYRPDQNLVERKLQDKHKCLYVSCKWSPLYHLYPCLPLGSVLGHTECHLVRNADRVSSSHYYSQRFAIERSGLIRPRDNWQISDGQPKTNCQSDHIPI